LGNIIDNVSENGGINAPEPLRELDFETNA
jgi:hypothetical protein